MTFFEGTLEALKEAMTDFVDTGRYKWEESFYSFQLFPREIGIE